MCESHRVYYNYLYIFDYSVASIFEIVLTKEDFDLTSEEILDKYGFKESQCSYMYSENKLEFITINN